MTDERKINDPEDDYEAFSLGELEDIRLTDSNYINYRYDSAMCEEYQAGNHYTEEDLKAAEANGIALTISNYYGSTLKDIRGVQEAALTSVKVTGENPQNDDQYRALGAKLFTAAKEADTDRNCILAYGDQINPGVGWIEVGRNDNPLEGDYFSDHFPWREMFFDMRARGAGLPKAGHLRRVRTFHKEMIKTQFKGVEDIGMMIDAAPRPSTLNWMNIEPPQLYRALIGRRAREVPLAYQNTPRDRDLRMLEECWKPVYLEGVFAKLPTGRVMLYDEHNSMLKMLVHNGIARLVAAPYVRWRTAMFCGQYKLSDQWSPYPWLGHPYIAFFGYREGMTGVPYGCGRDLISLQDEINSSNAKMHFGMDAVRIIYEENAISDTMTEDMLIEQAANKRGAFPMKPGKVNSIKFDHHAQLNEQNFKRAQDAKADLRNTSGVAGLNPVSALGQGASGEAMNAVTLRALASLGEIAGNYREGRILVHERLLEMVKEDIAQNGETTVDYTHQNIRRKATLQSTIGMHPKYGAMIANDVTLLKAEVGLEEVPNTVTYRGQQLNDMMKMAQSMPPEAVQARTIISANVIRLSDTPNGNDVAQHMLEQAGLAPPSTPEAQQQMEQQRQEAQQQKQMTIEGVMANIGHKKAQTAKLLSDADLKQAQAKSASADVSDPQYEQANQQLLLERTQVQNRRTAAQADKIEAELAQPPEPAIPAPLPERW